MLGASELHCTQSVRTLALRTMYNTSAMNTSATAVSCSFSLPNYYMFFFTPLLLRNVDLRQKLLNIGAQTMCVCMCIVSVVVVCRYTISGTLYTCTTPGTADTSCSGSLVVVGWLLSGWLSRSTSKAVGVCCVPAYE